MLQTGLLGLGATALLPQGRIRAAEAHAPVRTITRGPKHHWFAYYDKLQFDPAQRYVLGMEVDFEHRSPKADDEIRIGMVDLEDGDRWIELGATKAWSWQQGCMLQWIPGSDSKILWNDRDGDHFVCHILDVKSGAQRTVPHAIYALSPDGKTAVSTDFRRLNDTRPGYGYVGIPDPNADILAPEDSGIFRVDLESGEARLLHSYTEIAAIPHHNDISGAKHWFNHLLVNQDGTRFIFLHRWRPKDSNRWFTRMLTTNMEGSDVRVVNPHDMTSHFIWRDPQHILAWANHPAQGNAFYVFADKTDGMVESIGKEIMTRDGHCNYLPGNEWIVNDTYPDQDRMQTVYLYHISTGETKTLKKFHSPPEYTGEWRVDTHPRVSPRGDLLCIDSPHTGAGRQMHLIDVSGVVG
jgi:hypothetical protein